MTQPPPAHFSGIFISYRRDDSAGHAGRLFDNLAKRFGEDQIFMDIDTIEPGEDFIEVIQKAVGSCEIVIVVIGQHWLSAGDGTSRRLDNPNDFVRLEVATALKRNIRVIPVLVQKTAMPRPQDLPEEISGLSRRNALELSDNRWGYDVSRLFEVLERVLAERQEARLTEAAKQEAERKLNEEEALKREREQAEQRAAAEAERKKREAQEAESRKEAELIAQRAAEAEEKKREAQEAELRKEKKLIAQRAAEAEQKKREAREAELRKEKKLIAQRAAEAERKKREAQQAEIDRREAQQAELERREAQEAELKRLETEEAERKREAQEAERKKKTELQQKDREAKLKIEKPKEAKGILGKPGLRRTNLSRFDAMGRLGDQPPETPPFLRHEIPLFKRVERKTLRDMPPVFGPKAPPLSPQPILHRDAVKSLKDQLVWIPPGSFMMGSAKNESEKPTHKVTIREGFYMDRYEVTQARWHAVMGKTLRQHEGGDGLRGVGDNYPMYYVSWDDAQKFLAELNRTNDEYIYRLPTEAEWEYAARAGTSGDYAGDLDAMAWYGSGVGSKWFGLHVGKTHPVGQRRPNAFGLFDMHGNVTEWCQDWFHPNYVGAPTDGSAWLSGGEQRFRVARGGSWDDLADDCRSASRYGVNPTRRGTRYGFRIVAMPRRK